MKKILKLQKLPTTQPIPAADSTSSIQCGVDLAEDNSTCSIQCGDVLR